MKLSGHRFGDEKNVGGTSHEAEGDEEKKNYADPFPNAPSILDGDRHPLPRRRFAEESQGEGPSPGSRRRTG
jgi:hypothetical protein